MIARLILALLLAAFAFPAAAPAACHDAPAARGHAATMAMAGMDMAATHAASDTGPDRGMPDRTATSLHGCIGCVPPSNWNGARIVGASLQEPALLIERAAVLDLGAGVAPTLRPPRKS